jgi:hypothetical protein
MLIQGTIDWYARNGVWKRAGRPSHTAGAVIGGYYKTGNADIRPDITTYDMNIKGHTLYVSWAQGANAFPFSSWVDTLSRGGMMMNYVWEPKVYGASPPAQYPSPNATMGNWGSTQFYGWTQVSSGALDQMLDDVADAVKALPYNINIQICSERDTDHVTNGTINGVPYTWAQLDALSVTSISYIINRFKARGVTNATFTGGMGGFNEAAYYRCYCADVDFIQYNAYNHNVWQTADAVFGQTYNWLANLPAGSEAKPVWLAEWGCDADARRPAWLRSVPAAIAQLSRIKFTSYFNAGWGTIDPSDAASMQALADCFNDPLYGGSG